MHHPEVVLRICIALCIKNLVLRNLDVVHLLIIIVVLFSILHLLLILFVVLFFRVDHVLSRSVSCILVTLPSHDLLLLLSLVFLINLDLIQVYLLKVSLVFLSILRPKSLTSLLKWLLSLSLSRLLALLLQSLLLFLSLPLGLHPLIVSQLSFHVNQPRIYSLCLPS